MPSLDDHEGRLRHVEGICAENRWSQDSTERVVRKTAELLDRVESRVEHLEWAHEQSAAAVTKRQAVLGAVAVAVLSPTISALVAHFVK
jgi:hypothetical protein